jgi:hypothetical protein
VKASGPCPRPIKSVLPRFYPHVALRTRPSKSHVVRLKHLSMVTVLRFLIKDAHFLWNMESYRPISPQYYVAKCPLLYPITNLISMFGRICIADDDTPQTNPFPVPMYVHPTLVEIATAFWQKVNTHRMLYYYICPCAKHRL